MAKVYGTNNLDVLDGFFDGVTDGDDTIFGFGSAFRSCGPITRPSEDGFPRDMFGLQTPPQTCILSSETKSVVAHYGSAGRMWPPKKPPPSGAFFRRVEAKLGINRSNATQIQNRRDSSLP
jgi:hypothetical protein